MMKRLNYHHLYYFYRVALNGKLTEVAEQLHVSQSALSAQIKQLEQQTGTQLFMRRGRRLMLTEMGSRVMQHAQAIFSRGKALEHLLSQGDEDERERVSIGVLTNLSRNFVEAFISPLLKRDDVTFGLQARGLQNLLKGLLEHEFDMVLTNCAVNTQEQPGTWQQQLVARQPVAIMGPAQQTPIADFPNGYEGAQWVLPAENTEVRAAFEFFCGRHNYHPVIKAEADDMAMLRLLARDSQAMSVLPPVVVKDEVAQGQLAIYQYIPQAHENFYAISTKRGAAPSVINELLEIASRNAALVEKQAVLFAGDSLHTDG